MENFEGTLEGLLKNNGKPLERCCGMFGSIGIDSRMIGNILGNCWESWKYLHNHGNDNWTCLENVGGDVGETLENHKNM